MQDKYKKEAIEYQITKIAETIGEKRQDLFISEIKTRVKRMYELGYDIFILDDKEAPPLLICSECGFFTYKNMNDQHSDHPISCKKCRQKEREIEYNRKIYKYIIEPIQNEEKIEGFPTIEEADEFIEEMNKPTFRTDMIRDLKYKHYETIATHDLVNGYLIVEVFHFTFPYVSISKEHFFTILKRN